MEYGIVPGPWVTSRGRLPPSLALWVLFPIKSRCSGTRGAGRNNREARTASRGLWGTHPRAWVARPGAAGAVPGRLRTVQGTRPPRRCQPISDTRLASGRSPPALIARGGSSASGSFPAAAALPALHAQAGAGSGSRPGYVSPRWMLENFLFLFFFFFSPSRRSSSVSPTATAGQRLFTRLGGQSGVLAGQGKVCASTFHCGKTNVTREREKKRRKNETENNGSQRWNSEAGPD